MKFGFKKTWGKDSVYRERQAGGTNAAVIFMCIVAAFTVLAICSKSSFLYPINNWGDAGCYYTIGKGVLHGFVPYKDYAEQKGPIIFFIYALGELFNEQSFLGIYFIEVICAAIFLYFSVKTAELFYAIKGYETIIAFGLASAVHSCMLMTHGGGPEELFLCLMAYAIYLAARYVERNTLPSKREAVMWGICAGLLFWTKFTLCAVYIAIIAYMLVSSHIRKEAAAFWKMILFFALGCIAVTLPVLGYFLINGAFGDLIKWYFYYNLFMYSNNEKYDIGFLNKLIASVKIMLKHRNAIVDLLLVSGAIWAVVKKKYKLLCLSVTTFAFSFVIFNGSVPHLYTSMPLMAFCVFGLLPIIGFLGNKKIRINVPVNIGIAVACLGLSYVFCVHTYDMFRPADEVPQYTFAAEMDKESGSDYSLLYYGCLDPAFYYASGKLPKWKAFNQLNVAGNELKSMQDEYINKLEPDYIVTTTEILCDTDDYDSVLEKYDIKSDKDKKKIITFDDFGYELIDETEFFYEDNYCPARLYKRKQTASYKPAQ